jgi:Gluconate 2-dehydrogenase subunit 3
MTDDMRRHGKERRELLKAGGAVAGLSLLASGALVSACAGENDPPPTPSETLAADDATLLEDVADTILPTTPSSPGAKAAGVGSLILLLVNDCFDKPSRARIIEGAAALRARCASQCGKGFTTLSPSEREKLLLAIDAEARASGNGHWYHAVREVALRAYFSSEIGMTQALRYVRVPGRWNGCVSLEPGQPAWG